MTKQEFLDDITEWGELIDFCNENSLETCSDIIDDDQMDEMVKAEAESGWARVMYFLAQVDTSSDDYYLINGYGNAENLNYGTFEEYKEQAIGDFECNNDWDCDEEDEEEYDDDEQGE
jgi:hypothetical protein